MTTEANIISRDDPSAMLLPDTAVVGDKVWRVVNGRASAVTIVKGAKNGKWIEIRSGIVRSDIIVVDASAVPASGTIRHIRLGGTP
jgi:multidrug efflux pump subunit AcrA (membrane-fusion protein)